MRDLGVITVESGGGEDLGMNWIVEAGAITLGELVDDVGFGEKRAVDVISISVTC